MGPNMWHANYGYCNVPPPFFAKGPSCHGPPMFGPVPEQYPYHFARKPPKKPKPRPVPMYCMPRIPPRFGPVPYAPPSPAYYPPTGGPGQCNGCPRYGVGFGDGSGGYKPIPHSGKFVPLHILRRGTKADEITKGKGHFFRIPNVDFVQRAYPDNLSFKQFVLDFAGKGDWIVTQVLEVGNGRWTKMLSVNVSSDQGKKTMAEVGWTSSWGPVWVVVEKKPE